MPVVLTRIYTKTGDDGATSLADLSRVPKNHPRVVAYADVDEANSVLGLVSAFTQASPELHDVILSIQNNLYDVGSDLALPITNDDARPRVGPEYLKRLERLCDRWDSRLPPLRSFLIPGGRPVAAYLHLARTVTRRAERSAWILHNQEPAATNAWACRYLNRLSDFLFIASRVVNNDPGDVEWSPGALQ